MISLISCLTLGIFLSLLPSLSLSSYYGLDSDGYYVLPQSYHNPYSAYNAYNSYNTLPYYTQQYASNSYSPNLLTGSRHLTVPSASWFNQGIYNPGYSSIIPEITITPIQSPLIPVSFPNYFPISTTFPHIGRGVIGSTKIVGTGLPTHPDYRPPTQWKRLWPPMDDNFQYDPNTGGVKIGTEGGLGGGIGGTKGGPVDKADEKPEVEKEPEDNTEEKTETTEEEDKEEEK